MPSPGNYKQPSKIGLSIYSPIADATNKHFSFGTGRHLVYPVHVDKVYHEHKKKNVAPGPGNYDLPRTFGK